MWSQNRQIFTNHMVECMTVFDTSVHTPDLFLPAPAAPSLSRAWRGQTPSGPPRRAPHLAPVPLWRFLHHHGDETAPDASLHHSSLASVGLLFAFQRINSWRNNRSEEEVSSDEDKRSESDERRRGRRPMPVKTQAQKIEIKPKISFLPLMVSLKLFFFLTPTFTLFWNSSHAKRHKFEIEQHLHTPQNPIYYCIYC